MGMVALFRTNNALSIYWLVRKPHAGKHLVGEKYLLWGIRGKHLVGGIHLGNYNHLMGGKHLGNWNHLVGGKHLVWGIQLVGDKHLSGRKPLVVGKHLVGGKSLVDTKHPMGWKHLAGEKKSEFLKMMSKKPDFSVALEIEDRFLTKKYLCLKNLLRNVYIDYKF